MRRRFAWIIAGGAAFAALANTAQGTRAGTPLSTLRQAVAPAQRPLPASTPVVTRAETDASLGLTGPQFAVPQGEPIATEFAPAEVLPAIPDANSTSEPSVVAIEAYAPVVVAAEPRTRTAAPIGGGSSGPVQSSSGPIEASPIERLPADVSGTGATLNDDPNYRKPLDAIRIDVAPSAGLLPPNEAAAYYAGREGEAEVPRAEHDTLFFWQATNLCHRPLYFEQNYLERDGRSFGVVQPLVSGAQFFGSVPLLPYRMVRQPPCRCIYTLGESRPDGYGRRQR